MSNKEEGCIKRPAFQFYPADWRKDTALQTCSMAAQGLWVNLLCVMHECKPYGHLVINGKALTDIRAARLMGLAAKDYTKLLAEIEDAGVVSVTSDGVLFSRRMVRDEEVRNARAAGGGEGKGFGSLGAEHGTKGGRPSKARGVSKPPIKPPPSSSSSSSTSTSVVLKKTGLSENFKPETDADTLAVAVAAGLDLDGALMAFRAHHKAKGSEYVDWQAAWTGWVLNAKTFAKKAPGTELAKVSSVWHESAGGVDRKAIELGIAPIDVARFESRPAFRARVMALEEEARGVIA